MPMSYKFDIHHYGPFCSDIISDMDWLKADEIVQDATNPDARYSNYRPGSNSGALEAKFAVNLGPYQATIDSVANALGGLEASDLELLATLDYCFRWVKAGGGSGPWQDRTIARFKQFKDQKFGDPQIEKDRKKENQ